jgi:hypothetical protein
MYQAFNSKDRCALASLSRHGGRAFAQGALFVPTPTSAAELGGYFLGTCPAVLREAKKRTRNSPKALTSTLL